MASLQRQGLKKSVTCARFIRAQGGKKMNKRRLSNRVRLIAFFLTATLLVCTFGFTADGWKIIKTNNKDLLSTDIPKPTPDININNKPIDGDNQQPQVPDEPEIEIPKFYDRITGLECSEEQSKRAHLAFIMNPNLPCYGISFANLICEIPIEDGGTRLCTFHSEIDNLWKIGSLVPTRGYISNIVKYFGGICVANGSDDTIAYNSCNMSGQYLDLSNGYKYTEFTSNIYTNRDLLESGLNDNSIDRSGISYTTLPFNFPSLEEDEIILSGQSVNYIKIAQSTLSTTELKYNSETKKFLFYKNGLQKTDAINNKTIEFKNCFVLFADSITYDNRDCSQMIMDTIGQGSGYYFTNGGFTEIKWIGTSDGILTFYTTNDEILTVNRGTSYICFVKSSKTESIIIE